jgi:hypothetical protein
MAREELTMGKMGKMSGDEMRFDQKGDRRLLLE